MSYPYIRILYIEVSCNQALGQCLKETGRLLEEQYVGTSLSSRRRPARARERTMVVTVIGLERQFKWN
jgi:hypothetical protein